MSEESMNNNTMSVGVQPTTVSLDDLLPAKGPLKVPNTSMSFNVQPVWAEHAINLTSTSLEISFDHLRELFYKTTGGLPEEQDARKVSITLVPKFSGGVDPSSIGDQEQTKKHWEDKFASGDARLFPPEPQTSNTKIASSLQEEFISNVDSESIANLTHTKRQWEQKVVQDTPPKTPKSPAQNNNNIYSYTAPPARPSTPPNETAIEREIRLAQEREEELKALRQSSTKVTTPTSSMPIYKVPMPVRVEKGGVQVEIVPPPVATTQPTYREMTEADRDSEMMKRESIIEREIREQKEREEAIRREALGLGSLSINKEAEQSQLEHQWKERERVSAHESVVDKEIREQLEREAALSRKQIQSPEDPVPVQFPMATHTAPAPAREVELTPVEVMATSVSSSSSDFHSPASSSTSKDSQKVTYQEAISTYAHPGESLIARELREQREREEELRKRWADMGMNMRPEPSEPETPFQLPQPTVQHTAPVRANSQQDSVQTALHQEPHNGTNERRPSVDSQASNRSSSSTSVPATHQPESAGRGPKVRPFEDPEESSQGPSYRYVPQNETPIEREIRLSRERDEDLRQSRGLPARKVAVEDNEPEVEVDVNAAGQGGRSHQLYRKGEEEVGKVTMKRFANSRLQYEIEKEKQKESDLRQLGRIKTMSMDQSERPLKYTDVIPKENLEGPPPLKTPTPTRSTTYFTPTTPIALQPPYLGDRSPSPKPVSSHNGSVSQARQPNPDHAPPVVRSQSRPEPAVVSRYSGQQQQEADKRSQAESRIDLELRELKEREEELKAQRRRLSHHQPPAPPGYHQTGNQRSSVASASSQEQETIQDVVHVPTSPHIPLDSLELRHRHSSSDHMSPEPQTNAGAFSLRNSSSGVPGDAPVKAMRRKSALAEEWERKFGGAK